MDHALDAMGAIRLRAPGAVPPFEIAHVRGDGDELRAVPVRHLGYEWRQAPDGEGWLLRTIGPAVTMFNVEKQWGSLARSIATPLGVDDRIALTMIACAIGDALPDAAGRLQAARTGARYPRRRGADDIGDGARDREDWSAYLHKHPRGGTNATLGCVQMRLSTAYAARPDLFASRDPAEYRDVLSVPANAIACGAAWVAGLPAPLRTDPLATWIAHVTGRLEPSTRTRWGAVLLDDRAPLAFVAQWNDLTCLRAGEGIAVEYAPRPPNKPLYLSIAGASSLVCLWFGLKAAKAAAREHS
jgi:hypothetical protein